MDIEIVTDGLRFPEGPVWMLDGSVIVTEIAAGALTRVWPDGRKAVVAECGGGPNGAAIGPDGQLYVVNNGGMTVDIENGVIKSIGDALPDYAGGWVDRIDIKSGKVERLYEACDGRRLSAPNDIVFDSDGGIWFSDMGKDLEGVVGKGGVYYAKPDGSLIKRAADGPRVNGIGLSPDGKTLYGALSIEGLLVRFDVKGPGVIEPAGLLAGEVVAQMAPRQAQDSLAVCADGRVCVAVVFNKPGVVSVDPATGERTHHPFPDMLTTNICFGGPDMRDAWVTLSSTGRLAKVRWDRPGLRLTHYA